MVPVPPFSGVCLGIERRREAAVIQGEGRVRGPRLASAAATPEHRDARFRPDLRRSRGRWSARSEQGLSNPAPITRPLAWELIQTLPFCCSRAHESHEVSKVCTLTLTWGFSVDEGAFDSGVLLLAVIPCFARMGRWLEMDAIDLRFRETGERGLPLDGVMESDDELMVQGSFFSAFELARACSKSVDCRESVEKRLGDLSRVVLRPDEPP